jgi:iron-sulfur cluster repair protein YtfE (RIC family)
MTTIHVSPSKFDSITRYLSWDHDRLDVLLGEATGHVEAGDMTRARSLFLAFEEGLRRHIRLEEELLFPLFESRTGMRNGPTAVMRSEHRAIEIELSRMRQGLDTGDASGYATGLANLHCAMGPHNVKEEQVLYPTVDDMLDALERRDFVARLTYRD